MKTYYEKVFDEIIQIIKDNLELIYKYNDKSLNNIRKYCYKHDNQKYKPIDYNELIKFKEESIIEILNAPYLYDFRPLE